MADPDLPFGGGGGGDEYDEMRLNANGTPEVCYFAFHVITSRLFLYNLKAFINQTFYSAVLQKLVCVKNIIITLMF